LTRLEQFGWRGESAASGIARVVSAHGDYYHLVCNEAAGEILARRKKSAFAGKATKARLVAGKAANVETRTRGAAELPRPITGDFVRFRYNAQGESMITALLPRFSHFERKDPTARRTSQTLAVNFDTLFIMMSLNEDFSTARIDRYLTLAEDIGEAEAVVVVTKVDLREDGDEEFLDELRATVAGRAPILEISCRTGEGLDAVRAYARPGRTLAFIGSSGVGKSTLLNTLAGEEWAATQEIQEWSGKGRHTTTSRELALLPSGAMVIDTPGIREIGILGEAETVQVKGVATHRFRK
jgi:ribosome biogenesis GTPase